MDGGQTVPLLGGATATGVPCALRRTAVSPQHILSLIPEPIRSLWPLPPALLMASLHVASPAAISPRRARVRCRLGQAGLAHLLDHWVADRPLAPGAALVEAGLGAVCVLGWRGGAAAAPRGGLAGVVFCAPCVPAGDISEAALETVVDLPSGRLSVAGVDSRAIEHMSAWAAANGSTPAEMAAERVPAERSSPGRAALVTTIHHAALPPALVPLAHLGTRPARADAATFCLDPFAADACLHLGAHMAAAAGRAPAVPASVAAVGCCQSGGKRGPLDLHVTGSVVSGAALSRHRMLAPTGVAGDFLDLGTSAGPVRAGRGARPSARQVPFTKAPERAPGEARGGPRAAAQALYVTLWQASKPGAWGPASGASQPAISVAVGGRHAPADVRPAGLALRGRAGAGTLVATLLGALQGLAHAKPRSVALATRGAHPGSGPGLSSGASPLPSAAVGWGMTRVAAAEAPQTRWSLVDGAAPELGGGTGGSAVCEGVATLPLLVAHALRGTSSPAIDAERLGAHVLITGGLGGEAGGFGVVILCLC